MTSHRPTSPTESQLRDILSRRIMVLDGAMGTIIQQYKLTEQDYRGERFATFAAPAGAGARELFVKGNNELLTLTRPQVIGEIPGLLDVTEHHRHRRAQPSRVRGLDDLDPPPDRQRVG